MGYDEDKCKIRLLMVIYPGGGDIKSVTYIPITPNMRAKVAAGDVTSATQGGF